MARRAENGLPLRVIGKLRRIDRLLYDLAQTTRDQALTAALWRWRREITAELTAATRRGLERVR